MDITDWLVLGRSWSELIGRRVLVRVVRNTDSGVVEMLIREVGGRDEWFKAGLTTEKGIWYCCRDYEIVGVLPHVIPNDRTHAQMWGLLGTDHVYVVREWLRKLVPLLDEAERVRLTAAIPKLMRAERKPGAQWLQPGDPGYEESAERGARSAE